MMIEKLPEELQRQVDSHTSLQRYLNSLNSEKDVTPQAWLWDGEHGNPLVDLDDVLQSWESTLDSYLVHNDFEKNVLSFDKSSRDKWGPQGGHAALQEVLESHVLPTFRRAISKEQPSAFDTDLWAKAKMLVVQKFHRLGIANLRPMTPSAAVFQILSENADKLASNSGFPDFTRRKMPEAMRNAVQAAENGDFLDYPAILLFRYYRGKLRMVWMFPFAANLDEACYYLPLFNAMMNRPSLTEGFYAPWKGFEQVRKLVTAQYSLGASIAASDFSATDEHFTWFTTSQVADVLEQLFQKGFRQGLRNSLQHMHEIPLLISPTQYITGAHGVSSGSMWTNFVETVFDDILATYAHLLDKRIRGLYGIGDDMAWVVEEAGDWFQPWLEQIGESVGQEIKSEKTMLEPDRVKTLQRLFQPGYLQENGGLLRGVYPTIRALNSLVYPERWHNPRSWSFDMFAVRTFMILENCVDHPLFDRFVRFVLLGNPRLQTWVRQTDRMLDRHQRAAKLLPGLVPTYNQEKKESRLSTFQSVAIARRA
jgi:hypothetical protein